MLSTTRVCMMRPRWRLQELSNRMASMDLNDPGLARQIAEYWNSHIHDLEVASHPVGSAPFFRELEEYRFDKLRYLPKVVDFDGYRDKEVLEIGCGVGTDLVRFARGGARVTGVDLAPVSIDLARKNFAHEGLAGSCPETFSVRPAQERRHIKALTSPR